jgi:hypothetical protein
MSHALGWLAELRDGSVFDREFGVQWVSTTDRPALATALAAGLALIPIAMGMGEAGSEIQAPMAVVILFGLISSTALNMFVVPALYRQFGALARGVGAAAPEPVEAS